jgi:hypothetical protein
LGIQFNERVIAWIAILLAAGSIGYKASHRPTVGGDLAMVCGAVAAMASGENAYAPEVLARYAPNPGLPITYPPLANRLFAPVCRPYGLWMAWAAAALLSVWALSWVAPLPLSSRLAIVVAGFGAFEWALLMGNPSVLEPLILSVAFWAVIATRPWIIGAVIGGAAFLKLTPFAYLAMALHRDWRPSLIDLVGAACVVFVTGQMLSYLLDPVPTLQYWHAVTGGFEGFLHAEALTGGERHPSISSLVVDLLRLVGLDRLGLVTVQLLPPVLLIAFVALVATARHTANSRLTMALIWVVVSLCLPRLKPYAFLGLLPALAFLVSTMPARRRAVALGLTCVVPTLAFAATAVLRPVGALEPILPFKILFGYVQLYMTLGLLALVVTRNASETTV